jgi:hypothetical protein
MQVRLGSNGSASAHWWKGKRKRAGRWRNGEAATFHGRAPGGEDEQCTDVWGPQVSDGVEGPGGQRKKEARPGGVLGRA